MSSRHVHSTNTLKYCRFLKKYIYFSDPKIKARVRHYLAQSSNINYADIPDCDLNISLPPSPTSTYSSKLHGSCQRVASSDPSCRKSRIPTIIRSPVQTSSKSCPQSPHGQKSKLSSYIPTANGTNSPAVVAEPNKKQRFEAYMMTGDLILNYSRTPQSSGLITSHTKKANSFITVSKFF